MRSFLLGLLLAAAPGLVLGQGLCRKPADAAALHASSKASAQCIVENARALEPSGEAPSDIGVAAIAACEPHFRTTYEIVLRCTHLRWGFIDYGANPMIADANDQEQRRLAMGLAVRVVTKIRADRATSAAR